MIDLGNTTNLSADEVATSLAQLMNVMGTSAGDVERLGSALVDLGNKGASTERDIVQMAQRIAAAGASVGLSEQDVLGFASALSSVGVEAEAGGTAISASFKQIDSAVRAGGRSVCDHSGSMT
jgi:TP901 family phage tail tape measure protein